MERKKASIKHGSFILLHYFDMAQHNNKRPNRHQNLKGFLIVKSIEKSCYIQFFGEKSYFGKNLWAPWLSAKLVSFAQLQGIIIIIFYLFFLSFFSPQTTSASFQSTFHINTKWQMTIMPETMYILFLFHCALLCVSSSLFCRFIYSLQIFGKRERFFPVFHIKWLYFFWLFFF